MSAPPWILATMTAAIALSSAPAQAGNLCIGDLSASVCLEGGADDLSAAIGWDDTERLAQLNPQQIVAIQNLYRSLLGREADQEGLRTYGLAVASGWSMDKVREALAESREAEHAIHQLYREVLARSADEDGIKTYRAMMERGWGLHRIRRDLAASREAQARLQAIAL